ncbi:MAG: ferrous iron transport protein B [Spirochaetes bacterium]|nr:ferrous iron transport protein B [Spirochaetota bacterium]
MFIVKNKETDNLSDSHGAQKKTQLKKIVLVGNPNVGKSAIFNCLTGSYTVVSNYPGTTVEVYRGKFKIDNQNFEIVDTPGMYALTSMTEEEKVARNILLEEKPDIVIHVIDAKNIERMLSLTLQLIEAGQSIILVLNMIDELEKSDIKININALKSELKIPIIETIGTSGKGIKELKTAIIDYKIKTNNFIINYDKLEIALSRLKSSINIGQNFSTRSIGALILMEDEDIIDKTIDSESDKQIINNIITEAKSDYNEPLNYIITLKRMETVKKILKYVLEPNYSVKLSIRNFLSKITMHPVYGVPILFIILYFGLYKFVGVFGAGTLVDFLENTVFDKYINPFFIKLFDILIPWAFLQDLFTGEYGIFTLGLRYSFGIILPIVTVFFFVFAVIEDSGYLPRLAMLVDNLFKKIGLSGRAVIPMVLGLGCDTMATMVTRTLPTKRERIISTILLSLAIPCSAQLGVILAIFEGKNSALLVWAIVMGLVFLLIGYLTSKLFPGEKPVFYMEIPPLRLPKISNVIVKTLSRINWYLKEILPVFLIASVLIWLGQVSRIFDMLLFILKFPMKWLGLPEEAGKVFLFGFFRRDYGAAGLYDLKKTGLIDTTQIVVASIALTLFLPCVAQFLITIKERGIKTGIGISIFILFFSFITAFAVNFIIRSMGVNL